MIVKMLTNSIGTGIGNQIQMIPVVQHHIEKGDTVISDSTVYEDLGLDCKQSDSLEYDKGYFVFAYLLKDIYKQISNFSLEKEPLHEGYSWKTWDVEDIKELEKINCKLSIPQFHNISEKLNNINNWCEKSIYHLDGWEPTKDRIAILTSNKYEKFYPHWERLIKYLKGKGKDVRVYGDLTHLDGYVLTPKLKDFYDELRKCEYYYATDSGGMHLADILGMKGFVIWGETQYIKNKPVNAEVFRALEVPLDQQFQMYNYWLEKVEKESNS